jgi:hypothetical protein
MPQPNPHFLELIDAQDACHGVWLGPELWERLKDRILPLLESEQAAASKAEPELRPEPMAEWETLLAYWDFTYPPAYDVTCEHCGNTTEDWRQDTPRKFRLRTANLGGLVTFQCQACQSLVLKKHFKKHITVECQPYVERG